MILSNTNNCVSLLIIHNIIIIMKNKLIYLIGLFISILFIAFATVTGPVWFPGITPKQTARILIKDQKFGNRALWLAEKYGNRILEPLREASNNFTDLNSRNSFWVADVLINDNSKASLKFSQELFNNESNIYAKLVGAIGLASQGQYPEPINESSFLVRVAKNEIPIQSGPAVYWRPYDELAIIALGQTKNEDALPFLLGILRGSHNNYWRDAFTCRAIKNINDSSAVPTLRTEFLYSTFHAEPELFDALISLGDRQAVPLAITRIKQDGNQSNEFLVKSLEKVTGQQFGKNYGQWIAWWDVAQKTWRIPSEAH